jgi:hypothetical protein
MVNDPVRDLKPRSCELCDCQQWRWDGTSGMRKSDPPEGCTCGHPTHRHRFIEI